MAAANLIFASSPVATPGPVDLVFGAAEAALLDRSATLSITLPGLTAALTVRHVLDATVIAALPALTFAVSAQYDNAVPRPLVARVVAGHQDGIGAASPGVIAKHQEAAPVASASRVRHQDALPAGRPVVAHHHDADRARSLVTLRHQDGTPLRTGRRLGHQDAARVRRQSLARHADAAVLRVQRRMTHQNAPRIRRTIAAPLQPAAATGRWYAARYRAALPTGRWVTGIHQQAIRPPIGRYSVPPVVVPPPVDRIGDPHLLFCQPATGLADLIFGLVCEAGTVVIPIREVYVVINSFGLVRADTGQPLDVTAFSASLDADSWCWTWSASLPGSLLALVRAPAAGEMVELVATVNGIPLRLAVERIGRDRRFASSQLRVAGRGRAAWLDAPYSPVSNFYNTQIRTAQQLLADALTVNAVPIGWAIDWQIEDWTVPAGAWSHGGSYKDAATRIAEAGGGYVQAHDTAQTLIVKPRYPLAPWAWAAATPDLELPEAVCETEGIEWLEKPAYNAVWIVGGDGGRRDRIKRVGSDAATVAPTIVDALATDPIMTRQRGLPVLADTGRQAHISVRLPVLAATGIVRPGTLVRYTESGTTHIGLTRAVSIEQGWPELWQTVRIETHVPESV